MFVDAGVVVGTNLGAAGRCGIVLFAVPPLLLKAVTNFPKTEIRSSCLRAGEAVVVGPAGTLRDAGGTYGADEGIERLAEVERVSESARKKLEPLRRASAAL